MSDSDLNARAAVLKSLNNAAFHIPNAIIHKINKQDFFDPLKISL